MSEDTSFSKKKSKKSSRNSDEEEQIKKHKNKPEENENDEDEEISKGHKRKHKKNKKDKKEKSDDVEEEEIEEDCKASTSKNKKSESDKSVDDSKALGIEVHTANNWEKADLGGDEKRKLKFLKLMGAAKHQDVSGEKATQIHQHSRETNEIKKIDQDLEKQFTESLTNKINHTNHLGLGFGSTGAQSFNRGPPKNTHKTFDDDDSPSSTKKADTAETAAKEDPKAKFKKMSFVKANS